MNDQAIEQEIQAKGLTAPRVTPSRIADLMSRIVYTYDVRPNGSTTTLAHAFLDGNFYLATGVSACVSVENFNAELGKKMATDNAMAAAEDKLWELEGYALRERLGAVPAAIEEAALKAMVNRFLGWKLPADFVPDAGVSFLPLGEHASHFWPTGTNLLTADQALAMFKHCVEMPAASAFLIDKLEVLSTSFVAKTAPEQWLLDQVSDLVVKAKAGDATDHECCGKCQAEPAAKIGNEPLAPTLEQYKALTERMASDLQSVQNLLCVAVKKMGGTLAVSHADADGMDGMVLVGKPDTNNDFVLTLVEASTVLQ